VLVNKFNQTNIKSIYAIGDVTDKVTLTPVAIAEGHAFADREYGEKNKVYLL
jgi:glutathione reductase (NADPH)